MEHPSRVAADREEPAIDIVVLSTDDMHGSARKGLLQPIDESKHANRAKLADIPEDPLSEHPGTGCSLHATSIVYRSDKADLVALLGPFGCGTRATTCASAGFLVPCSGIICLDGLDEIRAPPSKRAVGLVLQPCALFPRFTVHENVAFGPRLGRDSDLSARVRSGLATVGLQDFNSRAPAELSGGQHQRLVLARSPVMEPNPPLLDEPLSSLDGGVDWRCASD